MAQATVDELCTRVQDHGYGTDSIAVQRRAVKNIYRRVAALRRWPWLEVAADTFTINANDNTYVYTDINADVMHVDALGIQEGSDHWSLEYIPYQQFRATERQSSTWTGTPIEWTRAGQGIRLGPSPDRAFTGVADYIKSPPVPADGAVTLVPEDYEDILVWGAVTRLAARARDWDTYNAAKNEFNGILREMMDAYGVRQRQNATHVQESGEIDQVNRHVPATWPS